MPETLWFPRSGFERLSNCVFLGRTVDKARRKASDLPIGEYLYGDNGYLDSRVLRFLGATAADLDALVRSQPSDEIVGRTLIERSRKSQKQIAWFNARMLLAYGAIFAMLDADEGRKTGAFANVVAGFYNRIVYPPFAKKFRRDEARSAGSGALQNEASST